MNNFRNLLIWTNSMQNIADIYKLTSKIKNQGDWSLADQINRAAVSIPSNISEGSSRRTKKDFARFIEIAIGSSYELESQLLIVQSVYEYDISDILTSVKVPSYSRQLRTFHLLLYTSIRYLTRFISSIKWLAPPNLSMMNIT